MSAKAKVMLVAVSLPLLGIVFGFFIRGCGGEKPAARTMTKAEVKEVLTSDMVTYFDSITSLVAAQKRVIEASRKTIDELSAEMGKTNAALNAVNAALKKYGDGLRGTTYVESETRYDNATAKASAATAKALEKIDSTLRAAGVKQEPLTWEYIDDWVHQTYTYDPAAKNGYFTLSAKNEFSVSRFERDGKQYFEVINTNPHTVTKPGTNHFEIPSAPQKQGTKKKRFFIGPAVTGGLTVTGKPAVVAGISVGYSVW